MKQIVIKILLIFLITVPTIYSQGLENKGGKIDNIGTIRVKSGQVISLPDTLGGRFEYVQSNPTIFYQVPNIVYNQLVFKNNSKKFILDNKDQFNFTKNLVSRDSLILDSSATLTTFYIGTNPNDVIANSTLKNNKSEYTGPKDLIMRNETTQQNIIADGKFSRLNIDNPNGVNIQSGGFQITDKLTLRRGNLHNTIENNFIMADSTEIERYVGASLSNEPSFAGRVNVRYSGIGTLTTGGEVPSNKQSLQNLIVNNTDSLILNKNITVNDSLFINPKIIAFDDTLTLASAKNPVFQDTTHSEVSGIMERNNLKVGERNYFHNPFTYISFNTVADANGISDIIMDIRSGNYSPYDVSQSKVRRSFQITMKNSFGDFVDNGFNAEFGYGWRNSTTELYDETYSLRDTFIDLILQRWDGLEWNDLQPDLPNMDSAHNWAYQVLSNLNTTGNFAIGLPVHLDINLQAKVYLEGAYIPNSLGEMRFDLWTRGLLINNLNPNEFPLDLIKNVDFTQIQSIPDSVVDWIVLNFRNVNNPEDQFSKLLLIRYDGKIVDLAGNTKIRITRADFDPRVSGTQFELTILHRNHSSVKTLDPVSLIPENNARIYDFSNSEIVFGGTASMKLVDITDGSRIYAMRAGYFINDINTKNLMLDALNPYTELKDYITPWENISQTGYLLFDYNLDGIVTTTDFNMSWNNRIK
jgi:hypothetical protein